MPNYNHGKYLTRAIEAIVSQSRPPDEFILVDDASTDNSLEIMESYRRRYPFIHVMKNERNIGAFTSFERATGGLTGDYIYAAAADDYVLPGFFEKAMDMAVRYPQAGILFGKAIWVDLEGKELNEGEASLWKKPLFVSPDLFLREYLDVEHPTHSLSTATIYRRDALLEVGGFRRELGAWSDTFTIRVLGLKYGACYIPERFVVFTSNPTGLSSMVVQDPKKILDIVSRAAWLMRSPKFRDLFPEDHVQRWEKGYKNTMIARYIGDIGNLSREARTMYQYGFSLGGGFYRLVGFMLLKLARLGRFLLAGWLLLALKHYKGDLSCYQNPTEKS
jgi:glycosyltransferase involved in cell wall biosynthesis